MNPEQRDFFVVTAPGLEQICAHEMSMLGLRPAGQTHGGVAFSGGLQELYLANLWLRTASRILVRLGTVSARDFPALYKRLLRLPWGRYLKPGCRCDIRVASHRSRLSHSGRIADVCRQSVEKALGTPEQADGFAQGVLLRLEDDQVEVSIDSSGDHLHRRGYAQARTAAPLRENLAAAALLACGYDGSTPLIDIMTGSGTFVAEAAMISLRRAPGSLRDFAFMRWPKYRAGLWQQLRAEAQRQELPELPASIVGIDSNPKAVAATEKNLLQAGLNELIQVRCERLQQLIPSVPTGLLIGNPPYGARLGKNTELKPFYRDLEILYGRTFRHWHGALLCPDAVVCAMPSLVFEPIVRFSHGGIKVAVFLRSPARSVESP